MHTGSFLRTGSALKVSQTDCSRHREALQRAIVAARPGYTEAKLLLGYVFFSLGEFTLCPRSPAAVSSTAERTNHLRSIAVGRSPPCAERFRRCVQSWVRSSHVPLTKPRKSVHGYCWHDRPNCRSSVTHEPSWRALARLLAMVHPLKASNTMIPVFRRLGEGEQRDTGVFEAVECGPKGIVFAVRTAESRLRTRAARFEDVEFLTYRTLASPSISCGAQVPAMDVYMTWRPPPGSNEAAEGRAVAIEILPER